MLKTKYFLPLLIACSVGFTINAAAMETDEPVSVPSKDAVSVIARLEENIGSLHYPSLWDARMKNLCSDMKARVMYDILLLGRIVGWLKQDSSEKTYSTGDYYTCLSLINLAKPYVEGRNQTLLIANEAQIKLLMLSPDYPVYPQESADIYSLFMQAVARGDAQICLLQAARLILDYGYSPTGNDIADEITVENLLNLFVNPSGKQVIAASCSQERHIILSSAYNAHADLLQKLKNRRELREYAENMSLLFLCVSPPHIGMLPPKENGFMVNDYEITPVAADASETI